MLSKAQNKYIRSLQQQKFRDEYKVFIAEGAKMAHEWLSAKVPVKMVVATEAWAGLNTSLLSGHTDTELVIVKEHELAAMSSLQTPNQVMLVLPVADNEPATDLNEWCLALDDIQDPGNMGTIIRIADWFGIRHIACSPGCVDVYNPKVVQSAMGGHIRVRVFESDLVPFLSSVSLPKLAATLNGVSVYDMKRIPAGVLMIGNESKGLSDRVLAAATQLVTIPGRGGAESLNAAVSAGILCALLLPC